VKAKERAKAKAKQRFARIRRLREIGAPSIIIKNEQLMMARNRQGILRSSAPSPALEALLSELSNG
jgi:hypothetical protein